MGTIYKFASENFKMNDKNSNFKPSRDAANARI